MPLIEVIKRYIQLISTEQFAKYGKDFAYKIQIGLHEAYNRGFDEPAMVSVIEGIVNKLNGLSVSANGYEISTKSIFIHGNKSRVEFEYYGQRVQRELGDLIFILTVIYNERKYFEKFMISQFKKDDKRLRWYIGNKEQLYLLSRFPSFRGARGSIVPMREFNLPNYSGCLGSFNLLFKPGDFVFVSAPRLEIHVGNKRSINMIDVTKFWELPGSHLIYNLPFDWHYIEEFLYYWPILLRQGMLFPKLPPHFIGILGFSHFASNIHDFVDKYLRGYIGELTYSIIGHYNIPAFNFLNELLSAIRKKAHKMNKMELMNLGNDFFKYSYSGGESGMKEDIEFDSEGGGFGIIYTSINLGEGKE